MKYASDWEKSAERYRAWWDGEIADRCCAAVTAPLAPWEPFPPFTPGQVRERWTDSGWLLREWTKSFSQTYFAGDAFPNLWLNLGPSGHAGYCRGSRCSFRYSTGLNCTTWYDPTILDWEQDFPQFEPEGFLYRKTLELAEELCRAAAGDFVVSMPDTSGNLDALACLRGSEELLMDMIDEPEAVERAQAEMEKIWERTLGDVYALVKDNNGGSSVGWMQVWAPGLMGQLQCDLSVMISPSAFERFAMPELERQCEFLEYPIYHFDGHEQIRHLDLLLSLKKLRAIQWTPVDGQPSPVCFLPELKRIQKAGKSLYLMLRPEEVRPILEELSSRGLHISVTAQSPEQADAILREVERLTHE